MDTVTQPESWLRAWIDGKVIPWVEAVQAVWEGRLDAADLVVEVEECDEPSGLGCQIPTVSRSR